VPALLLVVDACPALRHRARPSCLHGQYSASSSWSCPPHQIVRALVLAVVGTPSLSFTVLIVVVSCPPSASWGFPNPRWAPFVVVGLPSPALGSVRSRWAPFEVVVPPTSSSSSVVSYPRAGFRSSALGSLRRCRALLLGRVALVAYALPLSPSLYPGSVPLVITVVLQCAQTRGERRQGEARLWLHERGC